MSTFASFKLRGANARRVLQSRQAITRAQAPPKAEIYTVTLPKPIGVRFGRGNDGSAYVIQCEDALGNVDERIELGDKILKVSAPFGGDMWEAEKGFGQVMYAIRTRNGDVILDLEPRGGDMSVFEEAEMTEAERIWRNERAGGNVGVGTKEIQQRNYIARKETERKRKEMFEDALADFRAGKVQDAIMTFEEVKAMEPAKYIGDKFERVSRVYIVTMYNLACCYAALENATAGLEALEDCMRSGYDDYGKIRSDKNLAFLRSDERFKPLMDKYDEPILNENAIKALKSIFSFGKQ